MSSKSIRLTLSTSWISGEYDILRQKVEHIALAVGSYLTSLAMIVSSSAFDLHSPMARTRESNSRLQDGSFFDILATLLIIYVLS